MHGAAVYEVGVPADRVPALVDANVGGTERVLGAALTAGVPKAVYVSTVAVFGDTKGSVADEGFARTTEGFTSAYEQTKVEAHRRGEQIAARGLPLVVVQPGVVYGPGDPSTFGELVDQLLRGRLPALPFPDLGVTPVHRDDVAEGIVLALDRGVRGRVLRAGRHSRADARTSWPSSPRWPDGARRGCRPDRAAARARTGRPRRRTGAGLPAEPARAHRSSDGVTFWASGDKARRELGWQDRPLQQGLRELVAARG